MSRWKKILMVTAMMLSVAIGSEQDIFAESSNAGDRIKNKAKTAIRKGVDWLKAEQKENGAWSDENYPAMTAFGLWVFSGSEHSNKTETCAKAARFVAGFAQADGGIYKRPSGLFRRGGLSTYNTAVCMTALYAYDRKGYAPTILAARKFLANNQLQGDSPGTGGFGYDRPGKGWAGRPDLSNTAWALRAMRTTQSVEDERPGEKMDVNWVAALNYVEKLQNQNKDDPDNYGGFGYERGGSRGGTASNKQGVVTLRGYGSMTYAGLESMIFAQVDRQDPRVVSAVEWASRHWSVDENPGMGVKGLFYYYNIMAKALSATGGDTIPSTQRQPILWKEQLIEKLADLQREDGSWINKDNQFWEGNPMLVSAYALLAMEYAVKE